MQRLQELLIFLLFALFCFSCSNDQLFIEAGECNQNFTYANQIKPIIDRSCAYSGCHDGSGSAPGNFRLFDGMGPWLIPTKFETRVIDQRDMPPAYATGSGLSSEDLAALSCWIENNYSER